MKNQYGKDGKSEEVNAREAALKILYSIDAKGAYLNIAENEEFRKNPKATAKDKSFINELVFGVTENRILLDRIIMRFSKIKIKKMSVWIRNILRLGIYQIYFLDRIPESAACNESVRLAKKYARRSSGFINAVLRNAARKYADFGDLSGKSFEERAALFAGIENVKGGEYLSVVYSYPLWIAEKLIAQRGFEEAEKILKASFERYAPFIRVNGLKYGRGELIEKLKEENADARIPDTAFLTGAAPGALENCLEIHGGLDIYNSKLYGNGAYTLQNISSQLAVEVLDPKPGEVIIDACAAPGGKSTYIAELMENRGEVLAFDIHEHKIELIENAAKRLGIDIIKAEACDAAVFIPELENRADRVLADVPCSGLGVVHTKPDLKYAREAGDIEEIRRVQTDILENVCRYVKDGGVLVYSTCTILDEENGAQTDSFLSRHPEFTKTAEFKLDTYSCGGSGFYICRMDKRDK